MKVYLIETLILSEKSAEDWVRNRTVLESKQKYLTQQNIHLNISKKLSKIAPNFGKSSVGKTNNSTKVMASKTNQQTEQINSDLIFSDIETKTSDSGRDSDFLSKIKPDLKNKNYRFSASSVLESRTKSQYTPVSLSKNEQKLAGSNMPVPSRKSASKTALSFSNKRIPLGNNHVDLFSKINTEGHSKNEEIKKSKLKITGFNKKSGLIDFYSL